MDDFEKELAVTQEIVRKELASILRTALLHLESELTIDFIVTKFLLNETSPLIAKEIRKFRDQFLSRIKLPDFPVEEVKKGSAAVVDHIAHKILKRYTTEFSERICERVKLLLLLYQLQRSEEVRKNASV